LLGNVQTIAALLAGILLFAVPLYLWRRPRSAVSQTRPDTALLEAVRDGGAAVAAAPETVRPLPVKLADARVLECHDRGSRKTSPDQCDHVLSFEKALGDAIEAAHDCVPADAGAGSIQYLADLSFGRRRHPVTLALPRDGRSFQNAKLVKECAAGVRARISTFPVTNLQHAHARYKISVVATYGPQSSP
jgi:hypothetical protein